MFPLTLTAFIWVPKNFNKSFVWVPKNFNKSFVWVPKNLKKKQLYGYLKT